MIVSWGYRACGTWVLQNRDRMLTSLPQLIRPAAARTSLSTLARDAFKANRNGLRALTIGIDASYVHPNSSAAQLTRDSIWIFHAQIPVHGENPFLRTIFYKITTLLQQPVLPVFVFGPSLRLHTNLADFAQMDQTSRRRSATRLSRGISGRLISEVGSSRRYSTYVDWNGGMYVPLFETSAWF